MANNRDNAIKVLLPTKKKTRAWELDFLRGLAVICMCFDHMMFDLGYAHAWFSVKVPNTVIDTLKAWGVAWWKSTETFGIRFWGHYIFVFIFLFLVGTSCAFSRDNVKRGSLLALVSIAFTGVTFVLRIFGIMQYGIVFGILHCIALCILCAAALDNLTKFNKYLNKYAPLVIGLVIVSLGIGMKFWTFGETFDETYQSSHFLNYLFGTIDYGDDWFGLFPHLGAVLLGMYWGKAVYPDRKSLLPKLDGKWNKPFAFVGRHALLFYLAHQVVIAGIIAVAYMCVGYRL